MIISHRHKFIFIKTRKTAGTSIEVYLERLCGREDVITPVFGSDDEKGAHKERNYDGFYNHISASEVRDLIDPSVWNSYYKFAFDRNPWDKQVSMYHWRKHERQFDDSFESFCLKGDGNNVGDFLFPSDYDKYTQNGELIIDSLGRYENLNEDFKNILKNIGLPFKNDLPHTKSKYRKNKSNYRDIFNKETNALVEKNFKDEIENLAYTF